MLVELAAASSYPHLAANLLQDGKVVPGAQAAALVAEEDVRLGLIGLTPTDWPDMYEDFGLELPPSVPLVLEHAARLRAEGADAVVLLSHLGLEKDKTLAPEIAGSVDLVVGSHCHTLLPKGERADGLMIAQAGEFAQHLGVVELLLDGERVDVADVRVLSVTEETPLHPCVVTEIATIERELEELLAEVVAEVAEPLELADDRECAAAAFMADVIRERMRAEVGVVTSAVAFAEELPRGPLSRRALYEACPTPAGPGVTEMTGAQLRQLVATGLDAEFAADRPRAHRGRPRGLLHLSGAEVRDGELLIGGQPVDRERVYRVAGSDWELDTYGGYANPEWGLRVEYDLPHILREAVEKHLEVHPVVRAPEPRIAGGLDY